MVDSASGDRESGRERATIRRESTGPGPEGITPSMQSVTIVGAGVVGHACAVALRDYGYTGRITVVGAERHRPYDRPPLGRGFLTGQTTIGDLALDAPGDDLDVDWQLGVAAAALDPTGHRLRLATGRTLAADAVVITTGSAARTLPTMPRGAHTLRTIDDALALREELLPGARMVVVGAGVVGLEVASTARALGLDVTVLAGGPDALGPLGGGVVADAVLRLHTNAGSTVRTGLRVRELIGPGWVSGLRLSTGEEIGADVVLLDIGSVPAVGWLAGSGLALRGGVVCDEVGGTSAPGVVAVGDCAVWRDPDTDDPDTGDPDTDRPDTAEHHTAEHRRIVHWTDTRNRAGIAMAALLGVDPGRAALPGTVTSAQAGSRVQFAGRVRGGERITVEAGGVATSDLLAVYHRGDRPVAVLGINQPALLADWRDRLLPAPAAAIRDASAPG